MYLNVPHIVICGHTDCGGIKALEKNLCKVQEPFLSQWIGALKPVWVQVKESGVAKNMQHFEMIKANVVHQLKNLYTYKCVQMAINACRLSVHGWIYDLHTGDLISYDEKSGNWDQLLISGFYRIF